MAAVHYTENTPAKDAHHIQTWPRCIHCGLAVLEQPNRKQRPGNHRDEHKCKCHQYISEYTSMHLCTRHTGSNMRRHPLEKLNSYMIQGWPHKEDEAEHSMRQYWTIRSILAMVDSIIMREKRVIIPFLLQKQILQQLHTNHMGIERMRLLAYALVY